LPSSGRSDFDAFLKNEEVAKGMDPVKLKQAYGDKIVFWGGSADCQQRLAFGTPEDVAREVETNVAALAPGGGLVCAAVHNIQTGVPLENVLALFDTAHAYQYSERRTPRLAFVTYGSTPAMIPAGSCPGVTGKSTFLGMPLIALKSVAQNPHDLMRTSTSPGPGSGVGTSSSVS
jgi:hypothetical protein